MGHNHLGVLPRTRRWNDVVSLLESNAPADTVISASAVAAETQFLRAADDPVFVEAVRILLNVPLAARAGSFGQGLRDADIPVGEQPELLDLLDGITIRLDDVRMASDRPSDFGELAGRALATTLSRAIGDALPSLFGATPEDVKARARQLSWSRGIAELSRAYFGDLVATTLSYWLDRKLADHVGKGKRFEDATARSAFDVELQRFTAEVSRIIQEFSGGWYGKTLHDTGRFGSREAAEFGAVALKKIVSELKARQVENA